jgi:hypothetical protein
VFKQNRIAMAHKQLPGFGVELPEIAFDGVSCILLLNPEL